MTSTPASSPVPDPSGSGQADSCRANRVGSGPVVQRDLGVDPDGGGKARATGLSLDSLRALRWFAIIVGGLTAVYGGAWVVLLRDAWKDALHSYAVAIPAVSVWLIHQDREGWIGLPVRPARLPAIGIGLAGIAIGLASGMMGIGRSGGSLTLAMAGWVLGVWAAFLGCFGTQWLRRFAFSVGFLAFTIPFPESMVNTIETTLQYSTAWVVDVAFRVMGTTFSRDGRVFWLPGLRFEVAQECSGIRSSLVLFINSLVAAKTLLTKWSHRSLLALTVVPLGIARNAFRVCVITLLTVHVDPRIIHSPLHHRGGPLFFALSLVPLFLLLWLLRRREVAAARRPTGGEPS